MARKKYAQELTPWFGQGGRLSYANDYHYILLMPSRMVFHRAWGHGGTEESDKLLIAALFDQGIEIGEWFIQDLDYGNQWIHAQGTAALKGYLDLEPFPGTLNFAKLFRPPPTRWGLRGDPLLWAEMLKGAEVKPWPASEIELRALFSESFESLTGYPLSHPEAIYLSAYDLGGLSGGNISPEFWREIILPLLINRYLAFDPQGF